MRLFCAAAGAQQQQQLVLESRAPRERGNWTRCDHCFGKSSFLLCVCCGPFECLCVRLFCLTMGWGGGGCVGRTLRAPCLFWKNFYWVFLSALAPSISASVCAARRDKRYPPKDIPKILLHPAIMS